MTIQERGIPFGPPMVLANLRAVDPKSQTRRIVSDQPKGDFWRLAPAPTGIQWRAELDPPSLHPRKPLVCPYGRPGDRLYVREAWRMPAVIDHLCGSEIELQTALAGGNPADLAIQFEADGARRGWIGDMQPGRYRHGRFMPRWASRILLEVVDVRVERLQDITEADCYAEGIQIPCDENRVPLIQVSGKFPVARYLPNLSNPTMAELARAHYFALFESINGAGSVEANPWLWVVEYKRVTP